MGAAAALTLLFHAKAIREERWLRARYLEYREYEHPVKRFGSSRVVAKAKFGKSFPNRGERAGAAPGMVLWQMKRIIDTSEALGTLEMPQGVSELCASADASFDEEAGRLVMKLEAFLRPTDLLVKEQHFRADWLPENETVTESVARQECHEVAREIFGRWVRKVREAAPQLHGV